MKLGKSWIRLAVETLRLGVEAGVVKKEDVAGQVVSTAKRLKRIAEKVDRKRKTESREWTPVPNRKHPNKGFRPLPKYLYLGQNRPKENA